MAVEAARRAIRGLNRDVARVRCRGKRELSKELNGRHGNTQKNNFRTYKHRVNEKLHPNRRRISTAEERTPFKCPTSNYHVNASAKLRKDPDPDPDPDPHLEPGGAILVPA
ncbi:hypothetical protein PABG_02550 [Paracoccidioides brasiliensis Pb03]|nr:hypothetical protein PABG_02550 [Paracoccidioides brasiliensis Pb03]